MMIEKEKPTFHLTNENVCIRLKLHGEDVKNILVKNEWKPAGINDADFIFTNTCAFLKHVEDKTIETIRSIDLQKNKHQKLVVFGCLPYINLERLKKSFNGDIIISRDVSEFIRKFNLHTYENEISHVVTRKLNWISGLNNIMNLIFFKDPYFSYLYDKEKVYHLKISEGCLGNCAFCAEKNARGRLKSKKIAEIVKEFEKGLEKGYEVFSLNSDDTGVFGWDNKENIVMLLKRLLSFDKKFNLVITEFNPWGLVRFKEELIELFKSPKIVFVTIPLQSGSNRILNLMRRSYKIEDVKAALTEIRKNNRKLKINTHIIVGFPGETEEDFRKSLELVKNFNFNKVKVFEYSDRINTESYSFNNKVNANEIRRRYLQVRRYVLLNALKNLNIKEFLLNMGYYY